MPKFISKDGVWIPDNKSAKRELNAAGLETVGQKSEDVEPVETPVENADIIKESGTKEQRKKLRRIKRKRGLRSRKIRRKV